MPDAIVVSFDAFTTLGMVVLRETLAKVVQIAARDEAGAVADLDGHGRVLPLQLRGPFARSARALQKESHAALHIVDLDLALHVVDRVAGQAWLPSLFWIVPLTLILIE